MDRLQNRTVLPSARLEAMLDFIAIHLPKAGLVYVQVAPRAEAPEGVGSVGGVCIVGQCIEELSRNPYPIRVELYVPEPPARSYPATDQYVPSLPPILLRSFDEELFLVLAHECRHGHQFSSRPAFNGYTSIQLETDAEEFAYEMLFYWRRDHRCGRSRSMVGSVP